MEYFTLHELMVRQSNGEKFKLPVGTRNRLKAYKRKWAKQQQFHQQQQQQHLVRQYLSGHPQLHGIAAAVAAAQAQNIDYREGGGDGTIGFCGPPPQILQPENQLQPRHPLHQGELLHPVGPPRGEMTTTMMFQYPPPPYPPGFVPPSNKHNQFPQQAQQPVASAHQQPTTSAFTNHSGGNDGATTAAKTHSAGPPIQLASFYNPGHDKSLAAGRDQQDDSP